MSWVGRICGAGLASTGLRAAAAAAACRWFAARPVSPAPPSRLLRRLHGGRLAADAASWRPAAWLRRRAARLRNRHRAACGWRPSGPRRGGRGSPLHRGGRRRAGRTIGGRQRVIEIVAHPARRHEAEDPPGAGVDHQPPVVAAAVDHRDRVDEAALLRNAERRKPALAQHGVDLLRRQQSRTVARHRRFRRHRRIGAADIGHRPYGERRPRRAPAPAHWRRRPRRPARPT